jgi:hypothetical protein
MPTFNSPKGTRLSASSSSSACRGAGHSPSSGCVTGIRTSNFHPPGGVWNQYAVSTRLISLDAASSTAVAEMRRSSGPRSGSQTGDKETLSSSGWSGSTRRLASATRSSSAPHSSFCVLVTRGGGSGMVRRRRAVFLCWF